MESNKLKIAYCISGHIRTWKMALENQMANFIEPNDCDIFFYTSNIDTKKARGNLKGRGKYDVVENLDNDTLLNDIKTTYGDRLKKISIESEIEENNKKWQSWEWIRNGQAKKIYECNKLLQTHDTEYDFVVRSRPDLKFTKKIHVEKYQHLYTNEELQNMVFAFGGWRNWGVKYVSDVFAIGVPRVMDIYSNLYEHVEKPYDGVFNLEYQLGQHLKHNLINVQWLNKEIGKKKPSISWRDSNCFRIARI